MKEECYVYDDTVNISNFIVIKYINKYREMFDQHNIFGITLNYDSNSEDVIIGLQNDLNVLSYYIGKHGETKREFKILNEKCNMNNEICKFSEFIDKYVIAENEDFSKRDMTKAFYYVVKNQRKLRDLFLHLKLSKVNIENTNINYFWSSKPRFDIDINLVGTDEFENILGRYCVSIRVSILSNGELDVSNINLTSNFCKMEMCHLNPSIASTRNVYKSYHTIDDPDKYFDIMKDIIDCLLDGNFKNRCNKRMENA